MRTFPKMILFGMFILYGASLPGQVCIRVLCHFTHEPPALAYAFVETDSHASRKIITYADDKGIACLDQAQLDSLYRIPNGRHMVSIGALGYEARDILVSQIHLGDTLTLHLLPEPEEMIKVEIFDSVPMDQEPDYRALPVCRDSSARLPGVITSDSALKFLRERWYWSDAARQTDMLWGRVVATFLVDSLGYVSHLRIVRSDHPCLAQILESSLRSLPRISEEGLGKKGGPQIVPWHYFITLEFRREIRAIDRQKPVILPSVSPKKKKRRRRD